MLCGDGGAATTAKTPKYLNVYILVVSDVMCCSAQYYKMVSKYFHAFSLCAIPLSVVAHTHKNHHNQHLYTPSVYSHILALCSARPLVRWWVGGCAGGRKSVIFYPCLCVCVYKRGRRRHDTKHKYYFVVHIKR